MEKIEHNYPQENTQNEVGDEGLYDCETCLDHGWVRQKKGNPGYVVLECSDCVAKGREAQWVSEMSLYEPGLNEFYQL